MVYPSASSPTKLWYLHSVSYSHSWFHSQANLFSGSILEKDKFFLQGKSKAWPRAWFADDREPKNEPCQQWLLLARAAALLQHAVCPQLPAHGTIMSLSSGFKNSIAVGCVIFGTSNWGTTHTYKTNKEYARAKETLCEPKARRCSPSTTAPESARALPVTVHGDGMDGHSLYERQKEKLINLIHHEMQQREREKNSLNKKKKKEVCAEEKNYVLALYISLHGIV